uniref:Uncharacterized protein n=1 Tax=Anopheles culicifacies TaxID=139723 RepID=A0A182MAU5_9DIPT
MEETLPTVAAFASFGIGTVWGWLAYGACCSLSFATISVNWSCSIGFLSHSPRSSLLNAANSSRFACWYSATDVFVSNLPVNEFTISTSVPFVIQLILKLGGFVWFLDSADVISASFGLFKRFVPSPGLLKMISCRAGRSAAPGSASSWAGVAAVGGAAASTACWQSRSSWL